MDDDCKKKFNKESIILAQQELKALYMEELKRFNAAETKTHYLLILLGVLISLFTVNYDFYNDSSGIVQKVLFTIFVVIAVFVIVMVICSFFPKNNKQISNKSLIKCETYSSDEIELLLEINNKYDEVIESIREKTEKKQTCNTIAFLGTVAGMFVLIINMVYSIVI